MITVLMGRLQTDNIMVSKLPTYLSINSRLIDCVFEICVTYSEFLINNSPLCLLSEEHFSFFFLAHCFGLLTQKCTSNENLSYQAALCHHNSLVNLPNTKQLSHKVSCFGIFDTWHRHALTFALKTYSWFKGCLPKYIFPWVHCRFALTGSDSVFWTSTSSSSPATFFLWTAIRRFYHT